MSKPSRIQRLPHIDFDTPPNTKMSIKLVGEAQQYWCTFVGLEKDRYILLRLEKAIRHLAIPGSQVTVKYLVENRVFGFATSVTNVTTKPFPLLFLEYPSLVEGLDLRHKSRVSCFLPSIIYWKGEKLDGHILDISGGGCRIVFPISIEPGIEYMELNDHIFCQFNFDAREDIYIKCSVRSISRNDKKICIGLQFLEVPEETSLHLESYVSKIIECRTCCL